MNAATISHEQAEERRICSRRHLVGQIVSGFAVAVLFMLLPVAGNATCCALGCCDCSCVANKPPDAQMSKKADAVRKEFDAVLKKYGIPGKVSEFVISKPDKSAELKPECEWTCWSCSSGTCCGIKC